LGILGLTQDRFLRLKAQLFDVDADGQSSVFEDHFRFPELPNEVLPHAWLLTTLPGKNHRDHAVDFTHPGANVSPKHRMKKLDGVPRAKPMADRSKYVVTSWRV
jgi:hypothetical protein